jgi:ArsR family transcriptional regulator
VFKALSNEHRIRILEALRDGELCACEIQVALDAPQSTVASHLRELKDAGLVNTRRQGKWTYYRIGDTAVLQLLDIANALAEETA